MKILSIQVGMPIEVEFQGRKVTTGIFKSLVEGPVLVKTLNLEGDKQADLRVHGGVDKAVYAYSHDAYPWWKAKRPKDDFLPGAFGENLTIDSFDEGQVMVGDTFQIGEVTIQAVQPRFPCFKLGVKFKDKAILKTFIESNRPGIYFRVLKEGLIQSGDSLKRVAEEPIKVSIQRLFEIFFAPELDRAEIEEILENKALAKDMRKQFEANLRS